jgi:hypothetical protein
VNRRLDVIFIANVEEAIDRGSPRRRTELRQVRAGKESSIERERQISIFGGDWVMDRDNFVPSGDVPSTCKSAVKLSLSI